METTPTDYSSSAGDSCQVQLPEFEGPLDLLLHLVKRHELDIINIPIGFVTEKYIEYLDLMQAFNIDIAGEYLLMAATLAHLKSRELVPRQEQEEALEEGDDEIGDPRQELIRRLLEYQRYKEVAEALGQRPALGREIYARGAPMEKVDPLELPLAEVSIFTLLSSLGEVFKRAGEKMRFDVIVDRISITDRINQLVDLMSTQETLPFFEFFKTKTGNTPVSRQEIVVTFLSILEMARLKMIRVLQTTNYGEIYLSRAAQLQQIESADETYA